jgi:hypothetical protein
MYLFSFILTIYQMAETFNRDKLPSLTALLEREIRQPAPTENPKAEMFSTFDGVPPVVSYGRSKEVPCFSSAVSVAYTKDLGRHLVANRDIEFGKLVMLL